MAFFKILIIIFFKEIKNELNDILFNSIIGDNYNLSSIYHYNFDNIKIKHQSQNITNKIICILGVLVNQNGIKIEKEMLDWLLPEYDVYSIYQKYPGILYEYPALRFAQWIIHTLNKTILLYLHTKGAFHPTKSQHYVRKLWRIEFKQPRSNLYIQSILNNKTDISIPFRKSVCTWFNGMFISKTAFILIPEIPISKVRHFYEGGLFKVTNIRIKGIINDNQSPYKIGNAIIQYLNKKKETIIISFELFLILFIILIKLLINNIFIIFKYKKRSKFPSKFILFINKENNLKSQNKSISI